MIDLTKWKVGQTYSYDYIEHYIDDEDNTSLTYGEYLIGQEFIVLIDEHNNILSFVLHSHTGLGAHYKLIWKG